MKSCITLTNFETILPKINKAQEETFEHLAKYHGVTDPEMTPERYLPLIKRYGVKSTQIANRYMEDLTLSSEGADILQRTRFFSQRGNEVLDSFYKNTKAAPDHIVHVTCTGYVSPSPAQMLVNTKNWAGQTAVTHAYHMGCYASLPAVRIAEGLVAANCKQVDIVHTEFCSLHMDRTDHSPEQMVVQSLFADGNIKYSAVRADETTSGLRLLAVRELIVPNSSEDMSWITASWGMKMTLSREVPAKIASSLRRFVEDLCQSADLDLATILREGLFAVHPGGPKIIDSVKEGLELSEPQLAASRDVLRERGNMSSATLPHVWQKILASQPPAGKKVLSLAFGPGLTIFGAIFDVV